MDYIKEYCDFLKGYLALRAPLKAVFDSSDGTTGIVLTRLFESGTVSAKFLNAEPDGDFPAHGPDPWKPGAMDELTREVKESGSDFGAIFDADGDRVFFVDDAGDFVEQDAVGLLLMRRFAPPYLVDIRSGELLKSKADVLISRVGHYFIKKTMREKEVAFGAEWSGHYYFKDFFYCDSGIFAAVHMANAVSDLKASGQKLSEWLATLPKFYRIPETNFRVENTEEVIKKIEERYGREAKSVSRLDGLTMEFGDFWFNVRPSNTEPLLRLNLESRDKAFSAKKLEELSGLIA